MTAPGESEDVLARDGDDASMRPRDGAGQEGVGAVRSSEPDFRAALYGRYVSAFKGAPGPGVVGEPSLAWWDHKYLPLLDDLPRSAPIVELGCGDGGLLAYLGRRGFSHARGIDLSVEQVALAHKRGVQAAVGDLFELLESQNEAFAAILAVDVFEHLSREELVQLAPLLHAALRPRGRLLIQTANGAGLFPHQVIYGDLTHLTIFTPESLAQLLRPVGFGDFDFHETGPVPIRVRGKIDVALWAAIKAAANVVRSIETGKRQAIWTENFLCRAFKL